MKKVLYILFFIFIIPAISFAQHYIEVTCDLVQDCFIVEEMLKKNYENKDIFIQDTMVYLGPYDMDEIESVKNNIIQEMNLSARIVSVKDVTFIKPIDDIMFFDTSLQQDDFVIETTSNTKFLDNNTIELYSDPKIKKIISYAAELYATTPYKFGGENISKGLDCSFFVKYIYSKLGINLPRTSREQIKVGKFIAYNELRVGDLVFFKKIYYRKYKNKTHKYEMVNHVGIYLTNGEFIHAARSSKKVTISSLNEDYYKKHYAGARRILNDI